MRDPGRVRIDYQPGAAALEALAIAQDRMPQMPRQELIDLLLVRGLWTLGLPPLPPGRDRERWRLPDVIRTM